MESDKETDVKKTWRHVPHWTFESGIDFVTWRLHKNQFELASEEKDFIMDVLQNSNEKRYQLFSFVVMNDHVHVLFGPLKDQSFSKIIVLGDRSVPIVCNVCSESKDPFGRKITSIG